MEEKGLQQRLQRVEELIREIEAVADPAALAKTVELVRLLMDFNGAGLERMTMIITRAGKQGREILDDFARDGLVAQLLLLYGLHPEDMESRVRGALDRVRPYLRKHGGDAQLLGVDQGVVRLRLDGSCDGCPSSAATLKFSIEQAIYEAAPDVTGIVAEGVAKHVATNGLVQIAKTAQP
jgi:Fe-S cluster biogenesis protein NfuA